MAFKIDFEKKQISLPGWRFHKDAKDIFAFLNFVMSNIELLDKTARSMIGILLQVPVEVRRIGGMPDELNNSLDEIGAGPGPMETLSLHLPLLYELIFCRVVDGFLNYISELLTLIFETKPDMLKSREQISIKEVFEYVTREELLNALTERKVIALSFKGLPELNKDLTNDFDFALFLDLENFERARILVEQRNLMTHNRGYVNRRYLERVPNAGKTIGDKITFTGKSIIENLSFLSLCLLEIDERAESKFGIVRTEIRPIM